MPNLLYDALFGQHAGASTPFLQEVGNQTLTHADFATRASEFAHAMSGLGLAPGDRVALQAEKSIDALAVYAAFVQSGLVFLPLNPAYTSAEMDYFIGNSGASLLIASSARASALAEFAARHGTQLQTLDQDGTGSL